MIVRDLLLLLRKFDPEAEVQLLSVGGSGSVDEARYVKANGRCSSDHVELSCNDVPEEWLGDEVR